MDTKLLQGHSTVILERYREEQNDWVATPAGSPEDINASLQAKLKKSHPGDQYRIINQDRTLEIYAIQVLREKGAGTRSQSWRNGRRIDPEPFFPDLDDPDPINALNSPVDEGGFTVIINRRGSHHLERRPSVYSNHPSRK